MDTGVTAATNGKVHVQLVRGAHKSSEAKGGIGFHFHTARRYVVYKVRGWAKFDNDGVDTLVGSVCARAGSTSTTLSNTS
jgi:hypothetical protein